MTQQSLIAQIRKLPPKRRLQLIDEIYRSFEGEESFALTASQKSELKRRFEYYKRHPDELVPHDQVVAELERRAAKR